MISPVQILAVVAFVPSFMYTASARYSLTEDFQAGSDGFFDKFLFFTEDDPTHGFVNVRVLESEAWTISDRTW